MKNTFNTIDLESKWLLGLLHIEELPDLATNALANGFGSESVIKLAICSRDEVEEIERLFKQILKECGGGTMSKLDALKHYAKQISASILSKETPPLEGATLIWNATLSAQIPNYHELDSFIYAASEIEDRPSDKEFFESAIIEEAKRVSRM
jgi:hypothetical protein